MEETKEELDSAEIAHVFDTLLEPEAESFTMAEDDFSLGLVSVEPSEDIPEKLIKISEPEPHKLHKSSEDTMNQLYKRTSGLTIISEPVTVESVGEVLSTSFDMFKQPQIFSKHKEPMDKDMYYEIYNTTKTLLQKELQKNDYLHRKMINYYKNRKMLHIIAKEAKDEDLEKKYFEHLEDLEALNEVQAREQFNLQSELDSLKNQQKRKREEATTLFEKLQQDQLEFATKEFTDANQIRDNLRKIAIEKCFRRQRIHLRNLRKIRLSFIKLRNMYQEKQEALDSLDNLGPNLRLIDYEQLKMDNRNLHDKLEEKEMDLTRIRQNCQNAMQILAHQREKLAAVNTDIKETQDELENINADYTEAREELTSLKQEKDYFRYEINKMKEESGLMTKPKLLKDMAYTIKDTENLIEQVEHHKKEYHKLTQKVYKIRSIINKIKTVDNVEDRLEKIKDMFTIKPKTLL